MNETVYIALSILAGSVLGLVFFGGLWLTIKKSVKTKTPGLIFILSFVIRTGIVLLGFYYVSGNSWQRLIACLAGFTIARFVVKRYINPGNRTFKEPEKEVQYEA